MSEKIDSWNPIVLSMLETMNLADIEKTFEDLLLPPFYESFKAEKSRNSCYRFGQHTMNTINCSVSCSEIFYTSDEEVVKDFIACFLYEAGVKLKEGGKL